MELKESSPCLKMFSKGRQRATDEVGCETLSARGTSYRAELLIGGIVPWVSGTGLVDKLTCIGNMIVGGSFLLLVPEA